MAGLTHPGPASSPTRPHGPTASPTYLPPALLLDAGKLVPVGARQCTTILMVHWNTLDPSLLMAVFLPEALVNQWPCAQTQVL